MPSQTTLPAGSATPSPLVTLLRRIGIDRAVGFTVLGRAWGAVAGLVTLILLTRHLSPAQQGYYFTFSSALAMVVFLELGLQFVILQFASHERALLEWTPRGTLDGDPAAKGRLGSLLRVMTRWYSGIGLLFALAVIPAGLWFFSKQTHGIPAHEWQTPWIWIVIVSAGSLAVMPLMSVLEGCGLVAEIASMQAAQNVVGSIGLWLALLGGWQLFACPVSNTIYLLCTSFWVWSRKGTMLKDLWRYRKSEQRIDWKQDIWPLQWRTAISAASGYFIFQLFNPILFMYRGPVEAGRMGLSITVMNTLVSIALAWVTTKSSPFGTLIARRQFEELDQIFFRCFRQSLALIAAGAAAVWVADLMIAAGRCPIGSRVLPPLPMLLLGGAIVANHVTFSFAIYLRAHKQEPMVALSLTYAALMTVCSLLLGKWFGSTGMMAGYCVVAAVNAIGATRLFMRKRTEWHSPQWVTG